MGVAADAEPDRAFPMDSQDPIGAPRVLQHSTCRRRPARPLDLPVRFATLLALLVGLLLSLDSVALAAENLVRNGSFAQGSGETPARWTHDLWDASAGTEFGWEAGDGGLGAAVVRSRKPNDARWTQTVKVEPGAWYRLSGFVRAIGVDERGLGANLSILRGFDNAGSVRGADSGWKEQTMFFRAAPGEEYVTVACRLGSYGQESVGEARCTGIEMSRIGAPPAAGAHVYGKRETARSSSGIPAGALMMLFILAGIARLGRLPAATPPREALLFATTLLALLAVKLAIAPGWSYRVDLGTYGAWAARLADLGPARFYAEGYFADYPPGYMYVLWGIGEVISALEIRWGSPAAAILLKLPAMLADVAIAWLLFARLRASGKKLAWTAALAFAFNPALILNSTIWGQTDSILSLLLLLAFFSQARREFEFCWIFLALAILTKPQALLMAPLFVFWPVGWWRGGRALTAALAALATTMLLVDPFRAGRAWSWLIELYSGTAGNYAETSVNAMNLAALLFGMRGQDSVEYFGLTAQVWSFVVGLGIGAGFLASYLRARNRVVYTQFLAAATLVAFVCLTRMHERYLYPFFVFAGLVGVTGLPGAIYWALSALFLVNEWVVFAEQQTATAGPVWLWKSVGVGMTLGMLAWLAMTWRTASGALHPPGEQALEEDDGGWHRSLSEPLPDPPPPEPRPETEGRPAWTLTEGLALALLVVTGAILRFWNLGQPTDLVFDEVYFVEQAKNYLSGTDFMDPHPPFAKWMIALGIWFAGDEPFGWRLMNAISGTALIALMYLLGRELFRRRFAAFAAALFVAFDGLLLVDSRIAVIDIHYVTWAVGAYILTLRLVADGDLRNVRRLLTIGFVLGISVGAKLYIPFFSFLLVLGLIAWKGWQEAERRHLKPLRYIWMPIQVVGWTSFGFYLLTYAGDFFWGWWHSPIDIVRYIFVEVPDYQSAVAEAEHPYSSKWWTWPLLLKPIWYYWQDPGPQPGQVVGIWGSGNPAVWWASVPALLLAAWYAVREKNFVAGFVVCGWVLHLLPWVGIGRTLFLYHYLPCLLFAFLALAWMLDRLAHGEGSRSERAITGAILLSVLLPAGWATLGAPALVLYLLGLLGFEIGLFSGRADPLRLGKVVAAAYLVAVLAIGWYFLPIWLGIPLSKEAWEARMWISNSGIVKWI